MYVECTSNVTFIFLTTFYDLYKTCSGRSIKICLVCYLLDTQIIMVYVNIIIYDIFYLLNLFIHFTLKFYFLIYRNTKKWYKFVYVIQFIIN